MRLIEFGPAQARAIAEYSSRGASAVPLGSGSGPGHVYAIHVEPGGEIGPHPAGFGQLFLVVVGSGWVSGPDGVRRGLRAGQGAHIARGELHAKGSADGMLAVMIQMHELEPAPGGGAA
jgi:quercetin dioxygenase-like cupin family protein